MTYRPCFALLLDGGFLIKKLQQRNKCFPSADEIDSVCRRIRDLDALKDLDLLRIYFYHALPAKGEIINPISKAETNLAATEIYRLHESLLDRLEMLPDYALRLGETITLGWNLGDRAKRNILKQSRPIEAQDLTPNIQQKGVDLRIGLDIARLALRQMVSHLVVVTGDSDLVPAFKFARREGLRVYLDHMKHGVRRDLKAHVDRIL